MEKHYKEMLRFQLMEEIGRINTRVAALGAPGNTAERSLIARYGKLLFVSQQLLDQFPRLQESVDTGPVEIHVEGESHAVIPPRRSGTFSRRFDPA